MMNLTVYNRFGWRIGHANLVYIDNELDQFDDIGWIIFEFLPPLDIKPGKVYWSCVEFKNSTIDQLKLAPESNQLLWSAIDMHGDHDGLPGPIFKPTIFLKTLWGWLNEKRRLEFLKNKRGAKGTQENSSD